MKRIISTITIAILLCTMLMPSNLVMAKKSDRNGTVTVITGSDFQAHGGTEEGVDNINALLGAVKKDGYTDAYGFLFGGDYNNKQDDKSKEIAALKDAVKKNYPEMEDNRIILGQGNHDPASSQGLAKSGEHDTMYYGVYLLNEDDYSTGATKAKVETVAENLKKYLNQKSTSKYQKPIFIVSHLGLHFSTRLDTLNAKPLFDVINEYGGKGLNIIFLFGHNHSDRYDDYIGGALNYFEPGDKIYVARPGEKTDPEPRVINFTYMNAGYVGYTNCRNKTISVSVFEIDGNNVKIERYTPSGLYILKGKGAWNYEKDESALMYENAGQQYLDIAYASPRGIGNFKQEESKNEDFSDLYEELEIENQVQSTQSTTSTSKVTITQSGSSNTQSSTNTTTQSDTSTTVNKEYEETVGFVDNNSFELSTPIIIGIVAGAVVLIAVVAVVLILVLKKKPEVTEVSENEGE